MTREGHLHPINEQALVWINEDLRRKIARAQDHSIITLMIKIGKNGLVTSDTSADVRSFPLKDKPLTGRGILSAEKNGSDLPDDGRSEESRSAL